MLLCRFAVASALLVGLFSDAAWAQFNSSIFGVVSDSSGAVIAGATVTAINIGTNASRTVATNDAGGYSFPSLPPGTYTVKVEKPGFKTVVRNQIELQVQLAVSGAQVDWTILSGKESIKTLILDASGKTIVNAKVGVRIDFGRYFDMYAGYGRALTGDVWYKDIMRFEFRLHF